jgi:hypothetical protein
MCCSFLVGNFLGTLFRSASGRLSKKVRTYLGLQRVGARKSVVDHRPAAE